MRDWETRLPMKWQSVIRQILQSFLAKIIIGLAVITGLVVFSEWAWRLTLENSHITSELKNVIIAISDSGLALAGYILLYRFYEKRQIGELSLQSLAKYASAGFAFGFLQQASFILVIYFTGNYIVTGINPVSFLIPAFASALTAGFVAEIIIRGVVFRLTEEKFGTLNTVILFTMLFALLHLNVTGATLISVLSTAMQAGLLLSAAYVLTRSLWFTIFLHFAWDFAEPGIFGAVNPGNSIQQTLLASKITGSVLLTGGQSGPQNSIQALIICTVAGMFFLYLAKKRNRFLDPNWKT